MTRLLSVTGIVAALTFLTGCLPYANLNMTASLSPLPEAATSSITYDNDTADSVSIVTNSDCDQGDGTEDIFLGDATGTIVIDGWQLDVVQAACLSEEIVAGHNFQYTENGELMLSSTGSRNPFSQFNTVDPATGEYYVVSVFIGIRDDDSVYTTLHVVPGDENTAAGNTLSLHHLYYGELTNLTCHTGEQGKHKKKKRHHRGKGKGHKKGHHRGHRKGHRRGRGHHRGHHRHHHRGHRHHGHGHNNQGGIQQSNEDSDLFCFNLIVND